MTPTNEAAVWTIKLGSCALSLVAPDHMETSGQESWDIHISRVNIVFGTIEVSIIEVGWLFSCWLCTGDKYPFIFQFLV